MAIITQYRAKDGKLFDAAEKCRAYEKSLEKPKEPSKPLSFTPKILKEYRSGATFEEALKLSEKEGKPLLTNLQADEILHNLEAYEQNKKLFHCWTGLITVYENPGTPFGKYVKDPDSGWIFDIPKAYQGQKDIALVLQQKDYKIVEGEYGIKFLKASKMEAIPFPASNGWYLPETKFGLPSGEKSNQENPKARYLWRVSGGDPIRPVARYGIWHGYLRRIVNCSGMPVDCRLGVGVVEPQRKVQKGGLIKLPRNIKVKQGSKFQNAYEMR